MLTASEELEPILTAMSPEDFAAFLKRADYTGFTKGVQRPGPKGVQVEWVSCGVDEWTGNLATEKPRLIQTILAAKHDDPPLFDRACRAVNVQTDDARQLDYQRMQANANVSAAQSARVSADAAVGSEKHAAIANKIAKRSTTVSVWSLIISILALIVAAIAVVWGK